MGADVGVYDGCAQKRTVHEPTGFNLAVAPLPLCIHPSRNASFHSNNLSIYTVFAQCVVRSPTAIARLAERSVLWKVDYDTDRLILLLTHRRLPARLNVEQTAELLGFTAPDMTIIMSDSGVGLKPLGSPALNAPKFFAAVDVLNLAGDPKRLGRATEAVRKHHLRKRSRRGRGRDIQSHSVDRETLPP